MDFNYNLSKTVEDKIKNWQQKNNTKALPSNEALKQILSDPEIENYNNFMQSIFENRSKRDNLFEENKRPITDENIELYKNDFINFQKGLCYNCAKELPLKKGYLIKPYEHCKGKEHKDKIRIVCKECAYKHHTDVSNDSRDYRLLRAYHTGFTIYNDNGEHRKEVIKQKFFWLYYPLICKKEKDLYKGKLSKFGITEPKCSDFLTEFLDKYLTRALEQADWRGEHLKNYSRKSFTAYQFIIWALQTCARDLTRREIRAIREKKATTVKGEKKAAKYYHFLSTANKKDNSELDYDSACAGYLTPEEEFDRKRKQEKLNSPKFLLEFRNNVKGRISKNYVPIYEYTLSHNFKNQRDVVRNGGFKKDTVSRAFKAIKEAENYYSNKMF